MKTKEITLDWTADLLPMWEEPCCTDEICNCVKPITLKKLTYLTDEHGYRIEASDWEDDNDVNI